MRRVVIRGIWLLPIGEEEARVWCGMPSGDCDERRGVFHYTAAEFMPQILHPHDGRTAPSSYGQLKTGISYKCIHLQDVIRLEHSTALC